MRTLPVRTYWLKTSFLQTNPAPSDYCGKYFGQAFISKGLILRILLLPCGHNKTCRCTIMLCLEILFESSSQRFWHQGGRFKLIGKRDSYPFRKQKFITVLYQTISCVEWDALVMQDIHLFWWNRTQVSRHSSNICILLKIRDFTSWWIRDGVKSVNTKARLHHLSSKSEDTNRSQTARKSSKCASGHEIRHRSNHKQERLQKCQRSVLLSQFASLTSKNPVTKSQSRASTTSGRQLLSCFMAYRSDFLLKDM